MIHVEIRVIRPALRPVNSLAWSQVNNLHHSFSLVSWRGGEEAQEKKSSKHFNEAIIPLIKFFGSLELSASCIGSLLVKSTGQQLLMGVQ